MSQQDRGPLSSGDADVSGVPGDPKPGIPVSPNPVPTPPPTPTPAPSGNPITTPIRRTPLFEALHADRYSRQVLIREIESTTGSALLCMIALGQIRRAHTTAMVDLLHNVRDGSAIDLLLNSPGGDIDTAEKLITLVRKRAKGARVRVIVPDYAKSAATLVALGADKIVMSDTSELGPIDPQVTLTDAHGTNIIHSAQSYIDTYDQVAQQLRDDPEDPVAHLMLSKLDPVVLEKLRRVTKRSIAIATELLENSMIKDEDEAAKAAAALSDTAKWHSHGQMIGHEKCSGAGLDVTYLDPNGDLWQSLWRLYCLQANTLDSDVTLFESNVVSLHL